MCPPLLAARQSKLTLNQSRLDNGLQIVHYPSSKVPLATIVLGCHAGGKTETPATNGLTHLWEHLFFKGNATLPNQEAFKKRVRELGIVYNGDTSAEKVRYYITLPSAFFDDGMKFIYDAIATPLLEKVEVEKERKVVMDEYDRFASQPGFDMYNLTRRMIYGDLDHLRDPLGHRHLIASATRKQLLQIKDEVFVPANCALFISGDVTDAQVTKSAKAHFLKWKMKSGWKRPTHKPFPPFPKTQQVVMTRPRIENVRLTITYKGPTTAAQAKDTYIADVMISLLSHLNGKFYRKFVDSGLTLGSGLSYLTQSEAGELDLYARVKPEVAKKVKDQLLSEVKQWAKPNYFSASQLEDVKRQLIIDKKRQMNKPSAYAKDLAFWWAVAGLDYYARYIDELNRVTLAEVTDFAKRYLVDKPHLTMFLMTEDSAKKAGLKDNSAPLVKKLLTSYNRMDKSE